VVRVPAYRSRGPEFDSRRYQIFREVVCLKRGPLDKIVAPVQKTEITAVGDPPGDRTAQPRKNTKHSDSWTRKNSTSSRDTPYQNWETTKYTPRERKPEKNVTPQKNNHQTNTHEDKDQSYISQPTPLDGQPTFKTNGTWKLYNKIKTSPITATTSTKQPFIKPITIMLTIF
jgi:hypothetical protein